MTRLEEIRARMDAYAEGTTGREDRAYPLALVEEARELLVNLVGLIDGEWGYGAADDERAWIAKVDGEETDAD